MADGKRLITGIDCLTIPCEPGKKNEVRPIYIGTGYVCVFCGGFFFRSHAAKLHMGMIANAALMMCPSANAWYANVVFNEKLRCAFCPREFPGFETLSQHVQSDHAETVELLHELAENLITPEEGDDMLPPVGGGRPNDRQGQQGGGRRKPPAVPFLTVEDLKQDPVRARILAVETKQAGFNDLIVKVAIGGKSFFLGLKASNPNYETLTGGLGFDENKWLGQEFMIGLEWNEFYEKNFVNVFECPAKPSAAEPPAKKK